MSDIARNTIKKNLLINNNKLMKEFNYEKNNNENISKLKLGSHKKVWWICSKCGHEWIAEINNRNKGRGCPKCAKRNRIITTNSKLIKEKGSLLSINPSLSSEWNYKKNKYLNPKDFLPNSNKKVWWICSKCGHEWIASICNRNKGRGCSVCSNKKVLKGYNDLATTNPELLKEWNYKKNNKLGIKPNEVTKGSNKKVWWICSNNHNCFLPIKVRCSNTHIPCPFCSGRIPIKGYNDLATTNPELLKEWDYKKNNELGIKPNEVSKGSNKKVWWVCPKGHEYFMDICEKIRSKTFCPTCNKQLQTSFPEQTIYFYLKKIFPDAINRYKLDNKYEIDIYIPSKKFGIEYDGYLYHKSNTSKEIIKDNYIQQKGIKLYRIKETRDITKYENNIIYCKTDSSYKFLTYIIKTLFNIIKNNYNYNVNIDINLDRDHIKIEEQYLLLERENSLINKLPNIIKEWNYEKNGNIKPQYLSCQSHHKYWWKCQKCGYEWQAENYNRYKGSGCPVCSNQKVLRGYNDLATTNPKLLKEWDYEKNNKLGIKPEQVTKGSNKKVWWICSKCGHEWVAQINGRKGCPVCSNQKVLRGYNDLATTNPKLLKEWDYEKNNKLGIKPEQITKGSDKKVWWICSKCKHEWIASICNRNKGSRCPVCSNKKVLKGLNDLATTNPEILKEWDYKKNDILGIKPDEVTKGSNKKVWWICEKGHETFTQINNKTKGHKCGVCSNKKVLKGYNDLATTNPEILKEWNYEKNDKLGIKPEQVTKSSKKKVWWICSKCKHEWQANIDNRIRGSRCSNYRKHL